jgi:transcriptional antiterminator NusG
MVGNLGIENHRLPNNSNVAGVKVHNVTNDVNNPIDPLLPHQEEGQVPLPPVDDEPSLRTPTSTESVDSEYEVGPTDITGQSAEAPQTAPEADDRAAEVKPAKNKPARAEGQPVWQAPPEAEGETAINRQWYILKVQTNREESIRDALQRRVAMAGLDQYFGDIIVPTEMISEFKGGKKRVSKRKLYPGYIVVNMEINDDTWYLVRETSGIGDFTGAMGRPSPMAPEDVAKIVAKTEEKPDESPRVDIRFKQGDRVRIKEGTFENFEGNVEAIDQANGRVTVMINIFGRSTPVELEYWQIEAV